MFEAFGLHFETHQDPGAPTTAAAGAAVAASGAVAAVAAVDVVVDAVVDAVPCRRNVGKFLWIKTDQNGKL